MGFKVILYGFLCSLLLASNDSSAQQIQKIPAQTLSVDGMAYLATQSDPESTSPESEDQPPADAVVPDLVPDQAPQMTTERIGQIIQLIDTDAKAQGNSWQFNYQDRTLYLVYDVAADRMRLMSPIIEASELTETLMYRMLQANYDAVLDPRYAIARGVVWCVFIHPLSALSDVQLASAVIQVHTGASTFGTSFTSGGIVFGGGDSQQHHQRLLDQLKEILNPTT